jgi:hypothetical protein
MSAEVSHFATVDLGERIGVWTRCRDPERQSLKEVFNDPMVIHPYWCPSRHSWVWDTVTAFQGENVGGFSGIFPVSCRRYRGYLRPGRMPVLWTRTFTMAKKAVVVTEDDLEQLFKDDKKFAVQMLDSEYREHLWRYIKSKCQYFSEDDIHDVYQQALGEFIRCVQKPDFDPHKPLRLLQHIAKLRAIAAGSNDPRARTAPWCDHPTATLQLCPWFR